MSQIKKKFVFSVCFSAAILLIIALGLFINKIKTETYSSAKIKCEKILSKHHVEMVEIADDLLDSEIEEHGYFNEWFYIYYPKENFVEFEIDGQGMLGGQYWDLVYTKDGTFNGETELYLYKEADGNNIKKAERIDEHWWYVWTDYDGTKRSYK